jgi:DNA-directed RNA polymerase specialized sigma24 family protein
MTSEADRWYDDAAGPVVRPYAMTRGRTSHAAEGRLDLIALVIAESRSEDAEAHADHTLSPEHLDIVGYCQVQPMSIAELAADLDLPVGVVRVLVGDLLDAELVHVSRPVPLAELPDAGILREVISRLRAL